MSSTTDQAHTPRRSDWIIATIAGILAFAALVAGAAFGNLHGAHLDPKVIAWTSAAVVLVAGALATSRFSKAIGHLVAHGSLVSAGGAVRIVTAGVGYLIVVFAVLTVLEVSIEHLLVGAGLAGIVLGIAAQQSLGNVFAGIVLILARPFGVGDHIRVRSGSLGGIFDARVQELSLTYVTLSTEEGTLKVPNSAMLAAGVLRSPVGAPAVPAPSTASSPATSGDDDRRAADTGQPAGAASPETEET